MMEQKYQTKLNWQSLLGNMAIALGIIAVTDASALAQVGVRSRINAPTPLNITPPPGTHIPLPASNDHEYGDYDYYENSNYYHRDESNYDDYYYRQHHGRRHKNRSGNIIIINLPSETNYDSTNNTYIRIIRNN